MPMVQGNDHQTKEARIALLTTHRAGGVFIITKNNGEEINETDR